MTCLAQQTAVDLLARNHLGDFFRGSLEFLHVIECLTELFSEPESCLRVQLSLLTVAEMHVCEWVEAIRCESV